MNVRRFTALDMHGVAGTRRRRKVIWAEFVIGCAAIFLLAIIMLSGGHFLLGGYILGVAANYLPLGIYAVALSRPGALEAELAGVEDLRRELQRATTVQFLLLIPFLVGLVAALQRITGRRR